MSNLFSGFVGAVLGSLIGFITTIWVTRYQDKRALIKYVLINISKLDRIELYTNGIADIPRISTDIKNIVTELKVYLDLAFGTGNLYNAVCDDLQGLYIELYKTKLNVILAGMGYGDHIVIKNDFIHNLQNEYHFDIISKLITWIKTKVIGMVKKSRGLIEHEN